MLNSETRLHRQSAPSSIRRSPRIPCKSDPELSRTPDAAGPQPGLSDWYVIVEGTDNTIRTLAEPLFGRAAKLPGAEVISFGTYRLLWDLAKPEL